MDTHTHTHTHMHKHNTYIHVHTHIDTHKHHPQSSQQSWLCYSLFSPKLLLFSHQVMSDSAAPWTAAHQVSLSFTISQSLLKLRSIKWVMPSNHLILCCPLFSVYMITIVQMSFPAKSYRCLAFLFLYNILYFPNILTILISAFLVFYPLSVSY